MIFSLKFRIGEESAGIIFFVLVFMVLPQLPVPLVLVRWFQALVTFAAAIYFIIGMLIGRCGWLFQFCQSLFAMAAVIFLIMNYTPVVQFFVRPLMVFPSGSTSAPATVVLGEGIFSDGTPASDTFERTDRGIRLFSQRKTSILLFSTGKTLNSGWKEATVMMNFARSLGVPESAIIVEEKSRDLIESGKHTARLLKKQGIQRIFLISSGIHMRRAIKIFRMNGIFVEPIPMLSDPGELQKAIGGWKLFQMAIREYLYIYFSL